MGRPKQRMFSAPDILPRGLRSCFLIVDFGLLAYWSLIAFQMLPLGWSFQNSPDALVVLWNWSFLPIDILIAITGLGSIILAMQRFRQALSLALLSLGFSFGAGLLALSFGTLRGDTSTFLWLPKLFLLLYPLPFLPKMLWRTAR
ncbi:MAG: DUF5360 family protein [Proteobacteria bacterium]|nr:DUF5360 family protein [Pseudomonadota bacterium]